MNQRLFDVLAGAPAHAPRPLQRLMERVSGQSLVYAANNVLRSEIEQGEFDFLRGRRLAVRVQDASFQWVLSLMDGQIRLCESAETPEAVIAGDARDLLLLASRREDPDSLFFRRRLRIEGDTELGLHVKNVLDRLELGQLPGPLRWGLERAADFAGRR